MMKKYILIMLLALAGLGLMAQTNQPLPSGAVQFSNQLWLNPSDSTIWTGDAFDGKFVNLGSWHKVDSLLALKADAADLADYYTQSQIDAFLALKADASALDDFYTKLEVDGLLGGYVPTSRTVNGKALTGNITLNANDVNALQAGDNVSDLVNDVPYLTSGDIPAPPVTSVNSMTGAVVVSKADIGLGNVDNTSDANKPISTATQGALDGKENAFSKGSLVAGTGVTLGGTLTNRLVGSGNVTINASNPLTTSNGLQINSGVISPVYGTSSGTVAQGNDSRIVNGQTAYDRGDFREFGLGSSGGSIQINDITSSDVNFARFFRMTGGDAGGYIALPYDGGASTRRTNYLRLHQGDGWIGWKGGENATPTWNSIWHSGNLNPSDYLLTSTRGASNGVASLDGSGKVPTSQLPTTGMQYQGTWNANTNTPTLSDATGTEGYFYRVTTAGTQNLGSGNIIFSVGDDVIHNGSVWQRAPSGATSTNLAIGTRTSTTMPITNSNGTGVTLPARTSTLAGLMTPSDLSTLNSAITAETDPTVPSAVKGITNVNINNWNNAYIWGDHRDFGLGADLINHISGDLNSINTTRLNYFSTADGAPYDFGTLITLNRNSTEGSQIAVPVQNTPSKGMAWRGKVSGSWNPWRYVWDSGNFNPDNYLTTANFAWGNLPGKPSTFTPSAHTHNASDINSGVMSLSRIPTGTTGSTVALGNHTHTFAQILSKPTTLSGYGITDGVPSSRQVNTGAGLNGGGTLTQNRTLSVVFGTSSNTVAQGNDTRILNGQTAFNWGDFREFGLGSSGGSIQLDDITSNDANYARFFRMTGSSAGGYISLPYDGTIGSSARTNYIRANQGDAWIGWKSDNNAEPTWNKIWHDGNFTPSNYAQLGTGSTQVRNNSQLDARYLQSVSGGSGVSVSGGSTVAVDNTVLRTTGNQVKNGNLDIIGELKSDELQVAGLITGTGGLDISGSASFSSPVVVANATASNHAVTKAQMDAAVSNIIKIDTPKTMIVFDPMLPGTTATSTLSVSGATVGDVVSCTIGAGFQNGMVAQGRVTSSGTVTLYLTNATPNNLTGGNVDIYIALIK